MKYDHDETEIFFGENKNLGRFCEFVSYKPYYYYDKYGDKYNTHPLHFQLICLLSSYTRRGYTFFDKIQYF